MRVTVTGVSNAVKCCILVYCETLVTHWGPHRPILNGKSYLLVSTNGKARPVE